MCPEVRYKRLGDTQDLRNATIAKYHMCGADSMTYFVSLVVMWCHALATEQCLGSVLVSLINCHLCVSHAGGSRLTVCQY